MPEYTYYHNLRKHMLCVSWPDVYEEGLQSRLDNYFRQEKLAYEAMVGQYYSKEEQQEQADRKKYPLFYWKELCKKEEMK